VDGAREVRIHGVEVPVRARLHTIGGLSAHADRSALLRWLGHFRAPPRDTWVVHGEPLAAYALKDAINRKPGWRAEVPRAGQSVAL
jgi:metallo-beta-lactamase family protein